MVARVLSGDEALTPAMEAPGSSSVPLFFSLGESNCFERMSSQPCQETDFSEAGSWFEVHCVIIKQSTALSE